MPKEMVFEGICIGDHSIRATSGPHEGKEFRIKSRSGGSAPKEGEEVTFEVGAIGRDTSEAIFVKVKGEKPYQPRAWQAHWGKTFKYK